MRNLEPLWRTPTRADALDVLTESRAETASLIADLAPKQLTEVTALGGGTWSVKDLVGHLATWEHRALVVAGARHDKAAPTFAGTDDFNAHHLERKRRWSLSRVQRDASEVRQELVALIEAMEDEDWYRKVPTGSGRSALALVLGKVLGGGRHGYFAHDMAHHADLRRAVDALSL